MARKNRGRNEGSIWQQRNRWRAAVSLNGKRITKSFRTKAECRDWIRKKQNQIDQGLTFDAAKVTLQQYLTEWLAIHQTRVKPQTGVRYHQIARDYIYPYLGKHKLQDLRVEHVEGLYQLLMKNGVSIRNVRYVHATLHRCLKDALIRGMVGRNAAHGARQPLLIQKEMNFLDEYQVMQFLIAVKDHRNEALYHLAVKTGMRQGEILGLKWTDLDWNRSYLRVQRQVQRVTGQGMVFMPPKTKAGRRTIPLGRDTLRILRDHLSQQQLEIAVAGDRWQDFGLIFPSKVGTPQGPSNLTKEYKIFLEKADLPKIRFHDMRHTAASLMLNRGVPAFVVSKILGHSKPSTTMDIYGHLIPVLHGDVGNLMDELVTPIQIEMVENSTIDTVLDEKEI